MPERHVYLSMTRQSAEATKSCACRSCCAVGARTSTGEKRSPKGSGERKRRLLCRCRQERSTVEGPGFERWAPPPRGPTKAFRWPASL